MVAGESAAQRAPGRCRRGWSPHRSDRLLVCAALRAARVASMLRAIRRRVLPRTQKWLRRVAAPRARPPTACRTGRPRNRGGTARCGARCRRSAGSSRSRPPRGGRAPRPRRSRSAGRRAAFEQEVRGGVAERAAALVSRDDEAVELERSTEHRGRADDVSLPPERGANRGRGDASPQPGAGRTTEKPSRSRSVRSPERRTPKRKSSPATTATAPIARRYCPPRTPRLRAAGLPA